MVRVREGTASFATLWHASLALWTKIARHHAIDPGLEVDDLLQEIAIEVWRAVWAWESGRGDMSISQFAIWRVYMRARALASTTLRLQKNRVWIRFLPEPLIENEDLVRLAWYEAAMSSSKSPFEKMRRFSVVRDMSLSVGNPERFGWD